MVPPNENVVPESAAGIFYQLERALYQLAVCGPAGVVGVETDDDVAVVDPDLGRILEQDKLSLQASGHPFQDRAKGLWNTLLIWLKAASTGTDAQKAAELHLVTNRPVPQAAFVRELARGDKTAAETRSCVERLRSLGQNPAESMAPIMNAVCAYSDEHLAHVLSRIRLFDAAAGTDRNQLRAETLGRLHVPPDADHTAVGEALLGWIQDALTQAWRAGVPGWITRAAFDLQLDAILRRQRAKRRRERAERLVPVSEQDRTAARSQPFVERLIEVELDDDDILRAIECYIRFSTERLRLANQGDIVIEEWDEFFDHLCERWDVVRRRCARNSTSGRAEDLGQLVYRDTADDGYLAPLAGRTTEHGYFTSGAYNRLADNDRVWWHPDHQPEGKPADGPVTS